MSPRDVKCEADWIMYECEQWRAAHRERGLSADNVPTLQTQYGTFIRPVPIEAHKHRIAELLARIANYVPSSYTSRDGFIRTELRPER